MIKFFCDKCKAEIDQKEGGGTFTFVIRNSILDPKTKQIIPQMRQEELQLCIKHSQEILDYIKNKNKDLK